MSDIDLKNKPLVEAIFEIRWQLKEVGEAIFVDPCYKLVLGRMFERVKEEYPRYHALPSSDMPETMASHIVQYQFRSERTWPLIQFGPGILTLNDTTQNYRWKDFKKRSEILLNIIYELYPKEVFKPISLSLRYINADEFDYEKTYAFDFMKSQLKTNIEVFPDLFEKTGVSKYPLGFDLKFSFPSQNPEGFSNLRFVRGQKNGVDAFIWETQVQSLNEDVPQLKKDIMNWLVEAHNLIRDWFDKMIDGELRRKYE